MEITVCYAVRLIVPPWVVVMRQKLLTPFAMLALICLSKSVSAQQNPNGQLPVTSFPRPYLFLIRDPLVHKELGLNDRQRELVTALNDEQDAALWSMRNKSAQQITQTSQTVTEAARARLSTVLTGEQQRRLRQIELWTLAEKAFLSDELPNELRLSDDQRKAIRATMTKTQEALNDIRKKLRAGGQRESLEKQAIELRSDEQKQIIAALTRQQHQQWIARLGKRIDVSKLGRVKLKAPELHGQQAWLNSPPLTLRQLKGKVVALHFFTFA